MFFFCSRSDSSVEGDDEGVGDVLGRSGMQVRFSQSKKEGCWGALVDVDLHGLRVIQGLVIQHDSLSWL